MTQKTHHEWSKEALFAKAQLYSESMAENADTEWKFGLWSAFTLEMLVRGSVAANSPALVGDTQDWSNILYGLGIQPKKAKFVPKSASISDLVSRAEELVPDFSREHANFCVSHFARRNSEVHSGSLPFENVGSATWLPMFYAVCEVLLANIGESLETLLGRETAAMAREDIGALRDETAKSVKGTISAHKIIWEQKTDEERAAAVTQAEAAALRQYGHRVVCPACGSRALVQGKAAGDAKRTVDEDGIYERQVMKPEAFYCLACGLKITGYSKLLAAGLGNTYISTSRYDAVEFFNIDIAEHYRNMMEDDNNEY
jgi:DNA-directed RNA polymerase subunit RPC12/RpoP